MNIPRILFLTCMPLQKPKAASMVFMGTLLEQYPNSFAWFSLRSPDLLAENPFDIPYAYSGRLNRPSRILWLKQFLNVGLWAKYRGLKAASFGRKQGVEVVLADMAFEAVVAGRIAAQILNVPLLVTVHDDPINRIAVKGYPVWLTSLFAADFTKTMKTAIRCGVVSRYMGEAYEKRYGVQTTILYLGVEADKIIPAKILDRNKVPIIIGSVGSINSASNWDLLIKAVGQINQQHRERELSILHIGNLPNQDHASNEIEVSGWVTGEDFLYHLARIDVGFLNLWFAPEYAEICRTSLPTKIHSYIQAQRPMIALGPSDSSVVRFVEDYECGLTCTEPSLPMLVACLEKLLYNEIIYEQALKGIQKLKKVFSREQFFDSFEEFVNV